LNFSRVRSRHNFIALLERDIDVACALAEETSDRVRRATENMSVIGGLGITWARSR
jgi:hypothetical protein